MGYRVAVWRDDGAFHPHLGLEGGDYSDKVVNPRTQYPEYPGYAIAVNELAKIALRGDPSCDWIVTGGDDIDPDPTHTADEIAAQCTEHFLQLTTKRVIAANADKSKLVSEFNAATECYVKDGVPRMPCQTFGVMQPTGDPWSDSHPTTPRIIERVAGSPWLGREWCLRANQGDGPLWPKFFHMFEDECLQETAKALGVFWQRPDLCHFHNHWGRPKPGEKMGNRENMPAFLDKANSDKEWLKSQTEFERLKAGGFKECFPK